MVRVTYQKSNGCVIQRIRNTMLPYKIGDTTSMGWKVLNIEYKYNNKYYSIHKYNTMIQKDKQNLMKKKKVKDLCIKEIKTFLYCFLAIIIINFLQIFFGI